MVLVKFHTEPQRIPLCPTSEVTDIIDVLKFILLIAAVVPSALFSQSTLELARAAEKQGDFVRAEQLYKQAVSDDPQNFDAVFEYGMLLLRSRRPNAAIEMFANAIRIKPERHEPYLAQANAYLDVDSLDRAAFVLAEGENACRGLPEYWVMRGSIEATLGRAREAATSLRKARQTDPSRDDIAYQVGVTFMVSLLDAKGAEEHLREASQMRPESREFALAYVQCLVQLQKYADAEARVIGLLKQDPRDLSALSFGTRIAAAADTVELGMQTVARFEETGITRSAALTLRAAVYIAREMRTEGARMLDEALALDPRNVEALVRRSTLRLELQDLDGAVLDARTAVAEDPSNAACYRTLYAALDASGRKREAERTVRAWIAVSRTDPIPYSILAAILQNKKSYLEAAAMYEALIRLTPSDPVAYDNAAACHIMAGNASRSIEIISIAFERGIKSPDLYVRLALAHRQLSEVSQAIAALSEMRTAYPNDVRGWTLAAATHEASGRLREAIEIYKDLDARHPNLPDGLDGMARCYAALDMHLEAAAAWRIVGERFEAAIPALIGAAQQYIAAGKSDEADAMWKGVLEKRKHDSLLLVGYAQFLVLSKRPEEAVATYMRMIELSKTNSQPYLAAASVLIEGGQTDRAFSILESGLPHCFRDVNYIKSFARWAAEAKAQSRFDFAINQLFDSKLYSYDSVLAWVEQRRRSGTIEEAITELKSRLGMDSSNAALWYGLFRAHSSAGDTASALDAIERTVRLDPTNVELLRAFASASEAAMDAKKSAKAFELLARVVKTDSSNWLKAIAYYDQIGNRETVRELIREATRLFPEDEAVERAAVRYGGSNRSSDSYR